MEVRLLVLLEWIAFAASVPIVLYVAYGVGSFIYVFGPELIKPCMVAHENFAKNVRGDFVEYQVRDCAIIGSAAENRIGLRLADGFPLVRRRSYECRSRRGDLGDPADRPSRPR